MTTQRESTLHAVEYAERTYGFCAPFEDVDKRLDIIGHLQQVPDGGVVVDIGSGTGLELHANIQLLRPDVTVIGLDAAYRYNGMGADLAEVKNDVITELSGVQGAELEDSTKLGRMLLGAASWSLPLKSNSADLIISHAGVPNYLLRSVREQTLLEMIRVLNSGGAAVMGPHDLDPDWAAAVEMVCKSSGASSEISEIETEKYYYGMPIGTEINGVTVVTVS